MPVTLNNTQVVYNNSTTQTTAAQNSFTGTNQSLSATGYQRIPSGRTPLYDNSARYSLVPCSR